MMNGSCPVVQKAVTGNPYMAKEPMNLFIFGGHASEEIGKITKKRLGSRLRVARFSMAKLIGILLPPLSIQDDVVWKKCEKRKSGVILGTMEQFPSSLHANPHVGISSFPFMNIPLSISMRKDANHPGHCANGNRSRKKRKMSAFVEQNDHFR